MNLTILCALALVMGIAVFAFFAYHLNLLHSGTTTNETFKWSRLRTAYEALIEGHEKYVLSQKENMHNKESDSDEGSDSIGSYQFVDKPNETEEKEADGKVNDRNKEHAESSINHSSRVNESVMREYISEKGEIRTMLSRVAMDSYTAGCLPHRNTSTDINDLEVRSCRKKSIIRSVIDRECSPSGNYIEIRQILLTLTLSKNCF